MFVDEDGQRVADRLVVDRARALVIPPAWEDVCRDLAGDELDRAQVLALAVRLLDVGCMRIGGEDYAREYGSHGLTTLLKEHVRVEGRVASFDFPGKSGQRIEITVRDPVAAELVASLRRRRGPRGAPLLAFRSREPTTGGSSTRTRWRALEADDVNALIKALAGESHTAKDFRTWNATVITAVGLAGPIPSSRTRRARAINEAIRTTAHVLGNTPTVCRSSYVDPRLLDRYASGLSIDAGRGPRDERFLTQWHRRARIERAVAELLADA
jgi:DNA topoisomerase I